MVRDPKADIVYIASPHAMHREHTLLCLEHKKAVLCEKAFAINAAEARSMVDSAKANDCFLMEAFWTKFLPSYQKAQEMIRSGQLGELRMVRADFAFKGDYDPKRRLFNVALGGGSLLDIGVYPVFVALDALGTPTDIQTMADWSPSGAEQTILVSFRYPGGKMASLASSLGANSSTQAEYWLTGGYIRLNGQFNAPTSLSWSTRKQPEQTIVVENSRGSGYQYEAAHVMDCLDAGRIESDIMPWRFSIDMMVCLDRIRAEAGIVFPGHG
ncbi:Gfo/Idh/MocA family oxidoreductase [Spirochaetota bacterium]